MHGIAQDTQRWAGAAADLLDRMRTAAPQVHVLTSAVAQAFSANLLLAAGAQPSMSGAPGEIEAFVARTGALVANLGMLDEARRDALARALPILRAQRTPWVLDPVKVERSPERRAVASSLLLARPTVVRANALETAVLDVPSGVVVATTGAIDVVRLDDRDFALAGGHPLMRRVTAMGCAGTTLVAAFLAVEQDAFAATVAALLVLGVAGEIAGEAAGGPGTFQAHFLDTLHNLTSEEIAARATLA